MEGELMTDNEKIRITELTLKCLDSVITSQEFTELNSYIAFSQEIADYYFNCIAAYIIISDGAEQLQGESEEFELLESAATGSKVSDSSNVSFRGVDLEEFMANDAQVDVDDSENTRDLLEVLELERTSPAVVIEKLEPPRELIQKVVHPPREKHKITKFQKFQLGAIAAAAMLFVMVWLTPVYPTVATLTDSIDAEWVNTKDIPVNGDVLRQGELSLVKGMAEITFVDRAVVIVEGPAVIKLESPKSMFLSHGKVSAVVSEYATGFTVNTPSGSIIDLGTEFGVSVEDDGSCSLHMFKGIANLVAGRKKHKRTSQRVNVNEARSVDFTTGVVRNIKLGKKSFVRQIDSDKGLIWRSQDLDLADIVGGGNGFGTGIPEMGIDTLTGRARSSDIIYNVSQGSRNYLPVEYSAIDGVFVPDGGSGEVVISSTGLTFADCPDTNGHKFFDISSWMKINHSDGTVQLLLQNDGVDRNDNLSALFMHSNAGITFDLDQIRGTVPGIQLTKFTTQYGFSQCLASLLANDPQELDRVAVDFYVLFDGELVYRQEGVKFGTDIFSVDIVIPAEIRFMTLCVTDHNQDPNSDWFLIRQPLIHLE
jgi:hypothetical protein